MKELNKHFVILSEFISQLNQCLFQNKNNIIQIIKEYKDITLFQHDILINKLK